MNDDLFDQYSYFEGILEGDEATPAGMLMLVARMAYDPTWSPDPAARAHARGLVDMMLDQAQTGGFSQRIELQALLSANQVTTVSVALAKSAAEAAGRSLFDAIYWQMDLQPNPGSPVH